MRRSGVRIPLAAPFSHGSSLLILGLIGAQLALAEPATSKQDAQFSKWTIVFSDNSQQVQEWVKATRFTGKTKELVAYALWNSGNGKVVEWDGLENRCAGNRTVGSNPTLSAIYSDT
jgi:hypothetical protein